MSKSGKLYVKGRNGLPDELALIFGRFPTAGMNDGIMGEIASAVGNAALNEMSVDDLVNALKTDRANYDVWAKAKADGKSLDEARQEEHYADEAAREEAERKAHWENSGMGILDYIRSRMEDGDPEFDLDWEIAREMANDRAEARFAIGTRVYNPDAKVDVVDGRKEPAFLNLTTAEIRQYLRDRYMDREVVIDSDGTPVLFTDAGLRSTLKKRGRHKRVLHALDDLVKNSHYTRFEPNDGQEKHKKLIGQFVYTAAIRLADGTYGVELKLDVPKSDQERTHFKGQTIKTKIADAVLSVQPISIENKSTSTDEASAEETVRLGEIVSTPQIIPQGNAAAQEAADDAAYLDAVKRGDMETAQRMVREAAAKAMPDTKVLDDDGFPRMVYHGTYQHGFTVFKAKDEGVYTSSSKENAEGYSFGANSGVYDLFVNAKNPLIVDAEGSKWSGMKFKGIEKFKKALNTRVVSPADLAVYAREHGYDGVIIKNVFDGDVMGDDVIVYQPSQIKSADPVAYDDNGNVIPLSQRFNPASEDIRFHHVRGVDWSDITMDIFKFVPAGTLTAMGETEQSAAGLAGAIEKRGALQPTAFISRAPP